MTTLLPCMKRCRSSIALADKPIGRTRFSFSRLPAFADAKRGKNPLLEIQEYEMLRIDATSGLDDLDAFLKSRKETQSDVSRSVTEIRERVLSEGWAAVADYTAKFDLVEKGPEPASFRVTEETFEAAKSILEPDLEEAIEIAIERVRAFHSRQKRGDWFLDEPESEPDSCFARWKGLASTHLPGPHLCFRHSLWTRFPHRWRVAQQSSFAPPHRRIPEPSTR